MGNRFSRATAILISSDGVSSSAVDGAEDEDEAEGFVGHDWDAALLDALSVSAPVVAALSHATRLDRQGRCPVCTKLARRHAALTRDPRKIGLKFVNWRLGACCCSGRLEARTYSTSTSWRFCRAYAPGATWERLRSRNCSTWSTCCFDCN